MDDRELDTRLGQIQGGLEEIYAFLKDHVTSPATTEKPTEKQEDPEESTAMQELGIPPSPEPEEDSSHEGRGTGFQLTKP